MLPLRVQIVRVVLDAHTANGTIEFECEEFCRHMPDSLSSIHHQKEQAVVGVRAVYLGSLFHVRTCWLSLPAGGGDGVSTVQHWTGTHTHINLIGQTAPKSHSNQLSEAPQGVSLAS